MSVQSINQHEEKTVLDWTFKALVQPSTGTGSGVSPEEHIQYKLSLYLLRQALVEVTNVVNNLTTEVPGKVLDARQGKALADAIAAIIAKYGQPSGLATLGSDGKIPASQIPALALVDVFPVESEAAMLASGAEQGDMAIRSDTSQVFILSASPATTLSNWIELAALKALVDAAIADLAGAGRTTETVKKNADDIAALDGRMDTAESAIADHETRLDTQETETNVAFENLFNSLTNPLSIKPVLNLDFANRKVLDPRITFARASTGKYYDGKTFAKAEENLLLNSATLVTQNVSVKASPHYLSFYGTGTIMLSGACSGSLVGTGTTDRVSLAFTPNAGTLTVTVSGTVEKAQLEQRSSLTAYTPTTDQPITNYIPVLKEAEVDEARFDHDPVSGESLGLLIEEQRTNLIPNSSVFSSVLATITNNSAIAPDGTKTACEVHTVLAIPTIIPSPIHSVPIPNDSATYTQSAYLKHISGDVNVMIRVFLSGGTSVSKRLKVNLSTGALISADSPYQIKNVGNGWWRLSQQITNNNTGNTTIGWQVYPTNDIVGTNTVLVWGAQIEAGSFLTSYIPTAGSQVTRSADDAIMIGENFSSWYRQGAGSVYAEAGSFEDIDGRIFAISDGTNNNRIESSANVDTHLFVGVNAVAQASLDAGAFVANVFSKIAVGFNRNEFGACIDGGIVATDISGIVPTTVSFMYIGKDSSGLRELNGHIKKLAYYNQRLSNTDLQTLTT